MKSFLDDNFLLNNSTSERLYHDYAKGLPIIDYHNHLSPGEMASDKNFENLTRIWLDGDHYKWRAMRTNGVDEALITGRRPDWEKFQAWAATVPYTLRNPLYHWTHLELKRYFGFTGILNQHSARLVYDDASEKLQGPDFSVRGLLMKMNVELLCTTDDPIDSLEYHQKILKDNWEVKVLPAFRPDRAMYVDDPETFNAYLALLEESADVSISSFADYLLALEKRHIFFAANNCVLSDHGVEEIYAEDYTDVELASIFVRIREGHRLSVMDIRKFKSGMLVYFARWDYDKGFVQQFHIGAQRNNNSRKLTALGPDTGWDSIGDLPQAKALAKFLNRMNDENMLTKTILYNVNPADNDVFATMTGNFNDGTLAGKIQWGSAWWFMDQKDGMSRQLDTLSTIGLLSRFIGMVTDSRSFLSFPRHEYFRRILCNLFGEDIENGELPSDIDWIGKIVQDICYHNAKRYFSWKG